LPDRGLNLQRSLRSPEPGRPLRGLWFLAGSTQATGRHRVQPQRAVARARPSGGNGRGPDK
jgi:hypothetical protein